MDASVLSLGTKVAIYTKKLGGSVNRVNRSKKRTINTIVPLGFTILFTWPLSRIAEHFFGQFLDRFVMNYFSGLVAAFPNFAEVLLMVSTFLVLLAATVWFARRWWQTLKADLPIPGPETPMLTKFASDSKLKFRCAVSEKDIEDLSITERYEKNGQVVGVTNIEQVLSWWNAYPQGNFLATYNGKVIGGIDIWPLKRTTYMALRRGHKDEESIEYYDIAQAGRRINVASYWYIGSISMLPRQLKRERVELVVRLLVNALELWGSRKPTFPAHFLALAWTTAGTNILNRNEFLKPINTTSQEVFTRAFRTREEVGALLDYWRKFIG